MQNSQSHQIVVLQTVVSKSNPDKHYEIRLGGDTRAYCTCPAWRFSSDKSCKHLREFRDSNPEVVAKTV